MTLIESTQPAVTLVVKNNRVTMGLKSERNIHWSSVHGSGMILAFSLIVPIAITGIRSGMPLGFTIHWILQATAAVIVFASSLFALMKSWTDSKVHQPVHASEISLHDYSCL